MPGAVPLGRAWQGGERDPRVAGQGAGACLFKNKHAKKSIDQLLCTFGGTTHAVSVVTAVVLSTPHHGACFALRAGGGDRGRRTPSATGHCSPWFSIRSRGSRAELRLPAGYPWTLL